MTLCKYQPNCSLPYEEKRCNDNYKNCIIYQRKLVLDKNKDNYNDEPLGIGGCDEETYKRLGIEYISCEEQLRRLREIK